MSVKMLASLLFFIRHFRESYKCYRYIYKGSLTYVLKAHVYVLLQIIGYKLKYPSSIVWVISHYP